MNVKPSFSPGDEFGRVLDGLEKIVLRASDGSQAVTVLDAKRSAERTAEADPSGGSCRVREITWRFSAEGLPQTPEPGGRIEDGLGQYWTILEATRSVGGKRWKCRARSTFIQEELDSRVTVQAVDHSRKRSAGDREAVWCDLRVGVPARIQPMDWLPGDVAGQWRGIATHVIYFEGPLEIMPGRDYRCVDARGTVYRIIRVDRAERLDALPRAIARRE